MANKILVIIDETEALQGIITILQKDCYDAKGISSDDRVFEITHQFRPDIILISLTLNNTDGYFLCRAIKEKNKNLNMAVILMQQETDKSYIANSKYKPDDYIIKPFANSDMMTILNRTLAKLNMHP